MSEETTHTRSPQQYRISAAIFFFLSGFGYGTWISRIPAVSKALHLNEAQLGTALLALPIGLICTMPVTNRLLTHYSSRAIMLFGSLFLCVILVLMGFAGNLWQLAAALFFFGMARNLMTLSINTQGVAVQALYKKSIMATFHGIWSMAVFTGAAFELVMVFFHIDYKWHFILVSIVLAIATIYFINGTLHQKPIPQTGKPVFPLPDRYLLKFVIICFASMACENTMSDWSALYFQKEVNPVKVISTAALVVYLIAMTSGRLFGDRLVTRFGIKTVLRYCGIFILTGLGIAVTLPFTITAFLGYILVGFGVSCIVPMVFSLAGRSKNMSSSTALASISMFGYLGFVLVPPMVGYIAHAVNLRLSFSIIAMFGAVIIYFVSRIKEDDSHLNQSAAIPAE